MRGGNVRLWSRNCPTLTGARGTYVHQHARRTVHGRVLPVKRIEKVGRPPRAGPARNFVGGRANEHYQAVARVIRSPKRTASYALVMRHGRAVMFRSFSVRFKTRKRSVIATSSIAKWPPGPTARRSSEFGASIASATGLTVAVPSDPLRSFELRRMARSSGAGASGARECGRADVFDRLRLRVGSWPHQSSGSTAEGTIFLTPFSKQSPKIEVSATNGRLGKLLADRVLTGSAGSRVRKAGRGRKRVRPTGGRHRSRGGSRNSA